MPLRSNVLLRKPVLILLLTTMGWSTQLAAQSVRPKTLTRVFWQDLETQKLSYADVYTTNKWNLKRGWVKGFPEIDTEHQQLGDVHTSGRMLTVALRSSDNQVADDRIITIDSGVLEEPHGNHFHWKYTGLPNVRHQLSGDVQANSTNTNSVLISHRNGYLLKTSHADTKPSTSANSSKPEILGFGLSFAVAGNAIYVAHSDQGGDHAGQVDVFSMQSFATGQPTYSFRLPSADITNCVVAADKVFFRTSDGVYWVSTDTSVQQSADSVQIAQLSNTPQDISELSADTNWVLFTAGSGAESTLCMVDASAVNPEIRNLEITVGDGLKLSAPKTVLSLGRRYAFLFQERLAEQTGVAEQLTIVELDPNRDRSFADATEKETLPIGAGNTEGRQGKHSVCFDAYGRYAVFTNPRSGILTVMSLHDLVVRARFRVGGQPANIVAVGAPEHFH